MMAHSEEVGGTFLIRNLPSYSGVAKHWMSLLGQKDTFNGHHLIRIQKLRFCYT